MTIHFPIPIRCRPACRAGLLTLSVLAATANVLPAETVYDLQPYEVTGSRLGTDAATAGISWEVPGAGGSEEVPAIDTWAALEKVPGLHIEQPGGLAGNTVLYLRGGEPNFSKVLVDGIEVNNLNSSRGGTYNFNSVSLSGIEQIEVLGGAHSAIYGSDALSGVIRIRTMSLSIPEPGTRGDLRLMAGEDGYWEAGGRLAVAGNRYNSSVAVSHLEEDIDLTGESFEADRINGGLVMKLGRQGLLHFSALASGVDRRHYPDDSGGWLYAEQDLLDTNHSEDAGAQASLRYALAEATELVARLSWYRLEENDVSPGVPPGDRDPFGVPANTFDSVMERWKVQAWLRHRLSERVSLVAGGEYLDESGTSDSLVRYPFGDIPGRYELDAGTRSLFAEAEASLLENHQAGLALRWDDMDTIGDVTTLRASYQVDLPDLGGYVRLAYGEGFKKPSFFALGNAVVGNPDLRPEESELLELNLGWRSSNGALSTDLILFDQDFSDLIDLSESAPPQLINLESVQSRGATAALAWRKGRLTSLTFHATWLEVEVKDSNELLRNRPEWRAGLTAVVEIHDNWYLDLSALYVDDRQDSSIPTGTRTLDSYLKADLGLRWEARPGLWLLVAVDNLWDEEFQAVIGMPDPGRRFRLGTRWFF